MELEVSAMKHAADRRAGAKSLFLSEEHWKAIIGNDASWDGRFFYGVATTGIFCRPSCKSKAPLPENVLLFANADEALNRGFRPCKRCKPTGKRVPDQEWIAVVTDYIHVHYAEAITLDALAAASHGSPYHLHRVFKRVTGMTPVQYIQTKRMAAAKGLLRDQSLSIAEIGPKVGIPNAAYFSTVFRKSTGLTPAQYREKLGDES